MMRRYLGASLVAALLGGFFLTAAPAAAAHADSGAQCVAVPAKSVVTRHDAVTHNEARWTQQVPDVEKVSHTEYRFYRDIPADTHNKWTLKREVPAKNAVTHEAYKYKKVIPAVEGVEECQYKKWVTEYKTQYQYAKFTQTKTRTPKTSGFWQEFSPTEPKTFTGPPSWPDDDRGKWSAKKPNGGPQSDTQGVFQNGGGNGSWFYRQLDTPAGEWSAFGPWTQWQPPSHVSWEDFDAPSIGSVSKHGDEVDNGIEWYRQWQVRNTGETREVKNGGHWEYAWFTVAEAADLGGGWVETDEPCRWRTEPVDEQIVFYNDGNWTTDIPGNPWVQIDQRTVTDSEAIEGYTEYATNDGPSRDIEDADTYTEAEIATFDRGWLPFGDPTVVVDRAGHREYKTTDGTTLVLEEGVWLATASFEGWTVLDTKPVVDVEYVPGYPIYYVPGGEPTLVLGDSNWTTDVPEGWNFVDERVVTDKVAYDATKITPATYGPCPEKLAETGVTDELLSFGIGALGVILLGGMLLLVSRRATN